MLYTIECERQMHLNPFMLRDLDKRHLDLQYINKEEKK